MKIQNRIQTKRLGSFHCFNNNYSSKIEIFCFDPKLTNHTNKCIPNRKYEIKQHEILSLDCIWIQICVPMRTPRSEEKWKKRIIKQNKSTIETWKDPHFRMKFNQENFSLDLCGRKIRVFLWINTVARGTRDSFRFYPSQCSQR